MSVKYNIFMVYRKVNKIFIYENNLKKRDISRYENKAGRDTVGPYTKLLLKTLASVDKSLVYKKKTVKIKHEALSYERY